MSLFSRRTTMVVAAGALALPLAAGTANAAFDLGGDSAAPVEDTSTSIEGSATSTDARGSVDSPAGRGAVKAGENGVRATGCTSTTAQACAAVRGSGLPTVSKNQLAEIEGIDAEALGRASKDGASVNGSLTALEEDLRAAAEASTEGGSLTAETPLGDGSAKATLDGRIAADVTLDGTIRADDMIGGR